MLLEFLNHRVPVVHLARGEQHAVRVLKLPGFTSLLAPFPRGREAREVRELRRAEQRGVDERAEVGGSGAVEVVGLSAQGAHPELLQERGGQRLDREVLLVGHADSDAGGVDGF